MAPRLVIGTSGWMYRDWRGVLYDEGTPQRRWLEVHSRSFPTVEVNNTFYRLPERSVFEGWRAQTPEGFTIAVKASRYLTHVRRLKDPAEPLGLTPTGGQLGSVSTPADAAAGGRRSWPARPWLRRDSFISASYTCRRPSRSRASRSRSIERTGS